MRPIPAVAGLVAAAALAVGAAAPAQAADPAEPSVTQCSLHACEPLPLQGWEGAFRSQRVKLRSRRTGARLRGTVFAPPHGSHGGRHPGVVIVPGSLWGGREEEYHWSARELASHGYVVLGVDPQGVGHSGTFGDPACEPDAPLDDPEYPYPCRGVPFQQLEGFTDAALSGLDFLVSGANPFAGLVDPGALGVAGHSLGAAAAAMAQSRDERVKAIVPWDNLNAEPYGTDQCGPTHHVINGHVPTQLEYSLEQRAPAIGMASESECQAFYDRDPDKRKRGFLEWREAEVPAMQIVFAGVEHGDFEQAETATPGSNHDLKLRRFQWFTRAWFDLHLKQDERAIDRLLAGEVIGVTRDELISATWRSAAYLPSVGIDCADLRRCADLP